VAYNQIIETKKVTSTNFREIYSVDKSTKLKNGSYIKFDKQTKDTLICGQYQNNQKTGVWKYFAEENKLWMVYDFDKESFELVPEEISKVESFIVQKGDAFEFSKVDNPPIYLASKSEIEKVLSSNIKLSSEITSSGKSGLSIAKFVVGKDGKIKDIAEEQMLSKDLFAQIKKALENLEEGWIPAKISGAPVDSQILLVLDIRPSGDPLFSDKPGCIVIHLSYYAHTVTKRVIRYEIRSVDAGSL
jgi:hypothetical protein